MNKWKGKVAIVTGASAGIGAAIVETLVGHGLKVIFINKNIRDGVIAPEEYLIVTLWIPM